MPLGSPPIAGRALTERPSVKPSPARIRANTILKSCLKLRILTPGFTSPPNSKCFLIYSQNLHLNMADDSGDSEHIRDVALGELDMSRVDKVGLQGRVERDPIPDPAFRPGMIEEPAVGIDDTAAHTRRYAGRPRDAGVERCIVPADAAPLAVDLGARARHT